MRIELFAVARCAVSVRLSVRLSRWWILDCIHMAEDIVKLLVRPGSPITLVFDPSAGTKFQWEPLQRRYQEIVDGKNLRFFTEIAVCLRNGTRPAHGCYVTLIGSHK